MKTYRFKIFGHDYETKVIRKDEDEVVISVNGQEYKAYMEAGKKTKMARPTPKVVRPAAVHAAGAYVTAKPSAAHGAGVVKSPMPGLVLKVNVKVGDQVKAGQVLLTIEAMKMQNSIEATIDGSVTEILVHEGDSVSESQNLVVIE